MTSFSPPEKDACGVGLLVSGSRTPVHGVVAQGLEILRKLAHRGACGADGVTGDGAGLTLEIPDEFLRGEVDFALPPIGQYAVGALFFPRDVVQRSAQRERFAELARNFGLRVLGWRTVPVDAAGLGALARRRAPVMQHVFIDLDLDVNLNVNRVRDYGSADFRRSLFRLRRRAERELTETSSPHEARFYIASLSVHTLLYKGLLQPEQLGEYFIDLVNPRVKSSLVVVHSRFSTNTLPAWELAQPFRYVAHNGEINTLRGNLNGLRARERELEAALGADEPADLRPLIRDGQSDSQCFDDAIDLLTVAGRSLPHALMMLLPEAWENHAEMPASLKAFYAFHALRMEPWDGPAAVCFCDGTVAGAILDRNGLRPCRYQILDDGTLLMASEVGVLDIDPKRVVTHGRLGPGQMLVYDLAANRILHDGEIKREVVGRDPYAEWVTHEQSEMVAMSAGEERPARAAAVDGLDTWLVRWHFTHEDLHQVLLPMFLTGEEASSSMGNDTPLALLSDHPQSLFKYFRQLFAQVTNPPIDPIREKLVMSLTTYLGPRAPLLVQRAEGPRRLRLAHPLLSHAQMAHLEFQGLRVERLHTLFPMHEGDLATSLAAICAHAERAVRAGAQLLVLTDLELGPAWLPIPPLLALSAVHQHLLRAQLRAQASLIVESAEPRDVHHFACLFGYGADAVHPYLIRPLLERLRSEKLVTAVDRAEALFYQAVQKGLLKVMSKMGISTLSSYRGAQIFEILGLGPALSERYFPATPSRIGGLDLAGLANEVRERHGKIELSRSTNLFSLPQTGDIHYRSGGEAHLWNPQTITRLQVAARDGDPASYAQFSAEVEKTARFTLRGHLNFKRAATPLPLVEVEPAVSLMRRFTTGAMSLGALGQEVHETLAVAMNRLGAKSNSGEGGEDPRRFLTSGEFAQNSAIKQIASGRFGVTIEYLNHAQELQIKIAQGAKPGEGGQLPGHKVDPYIARIRHSTPGVTLISPPPHHDIYSIEDLAQLIFDLKNANPSAAVSVKLVAAAGVGTIAAGIAKAHADKIVISGDSGGTGASPLSSIRNAGSPWELGLAEVQRALVANGLRGRVRLETDGQLKNGRDVAIAALLGAEEFGFSTAPLVVQGCLMMRKCHLNTCPVGIATQDPVLRAKFAGQPEHLIRYFHFVAEELRQIMSEMGLRHLHEMVGRTDLLFSRTSVGPGKASTLDLSEILRPVVSEIPGVATSRHFVTSVDDRLATVLDHELIATCAPLLRRGEAVSLSRKIQNTDRSVGTMLSSFLVKNQMVLNPESVRIEFTGTAGQSFGAFLAMGVGLSLKGVANDYVGKGLSGGSLRIFPPNDRGAEVLVGNTCLYGATAGEAFLAGGAGERFAVRNSGALAVVEGVGDHGCEYMTGGQVIVLGRTGRNFAAGMSGGIAYVHDEAGEFAGRCNRASVELGEVSEAADLEFVRETLQRHVRLTGSPCARRILKEWSRAQANFVRVRPTGFSLDRTKPPNQLSLRRVEGVRHG